VDDVPEHAPDQTGEATIASTLAGTWTAQIARPRETSVSTFRFTADGHVLLVSGGVGAGTWTATTPDSFCYRIAEPLFDEDGVYAGWVHIEQDAMQHGNTFTSTGTSVVYGTDDARRYAALVTVSARRAGKIVKSSAAI
jgi:hypothetical protein